MVQAYLRVNGFFTVSEYPILERRSEGHYREATDIDVVAVRMADAGLVLPAPLQVGGEPVAVDPLLGVLPGVREMILAEVKAGTASVNPALARRGVMFQAMRRFGCCSHDELASAVDKLRRSGEVRLADESRIRVFAFGSREGEGSVPATYVGMSDVIAFLRAYIQQHRRIRGSADFRDPVMGTLALALRADSDS